MNIKEEEFSLKGWLIGGSRILLIASIIFAGGETYSVLKGLSKNVAELSINVKNLINITNKITSRIDKNESGINNLNIRVSVIESKGKQSMAKSSKGTKKGTKRKPTKGGKKGGY